MEGKCSRCENLSEWFCTCFNETFCQRHLQSHLDIPRDHLLSHNPSSASNQTIQEELKKRLSIINSLYSKFEKDCDDFMAKFQLAKLELQKKLQTFIDEYLDLMKKSSFTPEDLGKLNDIENSSMFLKESFDDLDMSAIEKYFKQDLWTIKKFKKNKITNENMLFRNTNHALQVLGKYFDIYLSLNHNGIGCSEISDDENFIITGDYDGKIIIWNLINYTIKFSYKCSKNPITAVSISQDNTTALVASENGKIYVFDINLKELIDIYQEHTSPVTKLLLIPPSLCISISTEDFSILIYNYKDLKTYKTFQSQNNIINTICLTNSKKYLISGSENSTISIYNINEKSLTHTLIGHESFITKLIVSSKDQILASASGDSSIRLWDMKTYELFGILEEHESTPLDISFSSDDLFLISCGYDYNIKIWDIVDKKCVIRVQENEFCPMKCCFSYKNHKSLLTDDLKKSIANFEPKMNYEYCFYCGEESIIKCVKLSTGDIVKKGINYKYARGFFMLKNSQDLIVVGKEQPSVQVWKIDEDKRIDCFDGHLKKILWVSVCDDKRIDCFYGHLKKILWVSVCDDNKFVASIDEDGVAKVWDLEKKSLIQTFKAHDDVFEWGIQQIHFSRCSKYIITFSEDKKIILWDWLAGNKITTLIKQNICSSIAISFSNTLLASGQIEGNISLYSFPSLEKQGKFKDPSRSQISSLSFSHNNTKIVIGNTEGLLKIIDLVEKTILAVLEGHSSYITSIYFGKNDEYLLTSSIGCAVRIWDLLTNKEIAKVTNEKNSKKLLGKYPELKFLVDGIENDAENYSGKGSFDISDFP
ncbi:hypothetical protein SteCoe_18799 [Stentor coeruleus]|uniref:Uncharacterized protein n=1 Tax=Stentor coeruleus TaxID=5963 RepID=A0A1R2BVJ9_9CILI|nr:hypothetical protein SteCoe_18799 [Stentor coeruleus]